MRRFVTPSAFALAMLVLPSAAKAQDHGADAARATARSLAREGYEAQRKGQYALAADRYERAEALLDAPTLLLGLARAQVGLGKLVEADETYRKILRSPLGPGAPSAFAKAYDDATHESLAVAARRAWVTLAVQGPSAPKVVIDDVAVPGAAIGVRLATNPGSHVIKVTAPGYAPLERPFAIAEGGQETISLSMEALAAPVEAASVAPSPPAESPPPAPDQNTSSSSSWQTPAGIGSLSVGITGLVVGAVTGVIVLARHASLSNECPNGHCSPGESSALSTYRTLADVSTVATIVGIVGTAAGITLLVTAPKSTSVGLYVNPASAGVMGRF